MVVVAIIGILMTVAVLSIRSTTYAGTPQGFAEKIVSEIEHTRLRAISSRRWQRLHVNADQINHWEASVEGMVKPTDPDAWDLVRSVSAPGDTEVALVDDSTHLYENTGVPAVGSGLGSVIDFAPDGAGSAATIFVRDRNDRQRFRVAIYRATGTAYVYEGW
jgi:Tfp pilus assembly protein FimT